MRYDKKINLKLYTYSENSFILQAIIDDYQEISFNHNLFEAGDFTISINYNIPNSQKFERGMFIQFGNDPYMFGEITSITDSIGPDGKGSQIRTIYGKDARYIFKRRVIKELNNSENWQMTAKGELCLRQLIYDQCGAGTEAKRQMPVQNVIPSTSDAIGKEYTVAESFTNLYDTLVTIATQSEIGWRIRFDGTLTLECFEGNDLSSQVQFSTDFETLANGEFTDSSESYANSVYVGGKGTGDERDIYEGEFEIEGSSPAGLARFEAWDNQSEMTSESEYEAEALSILTQYGQTINIAGSGLAKCPYVFKEQYDIGDIITLAFSGKSAVAQILSVQEHWANGVYEIYFTFGKAKNDYDRQMQLLLRMIQKAGNKTNATSSVKWYTIPTILTMPKNDVFFDTIGFTGNVGTGETFTLYWDEEKTGAKTYNVYFKNLAGTGKLTLTTGVTGKANAVMPSGTYTAVIYVDAEGNVSLTSATPVQTVEQGNPQPTSSASVYEAIGSKPEIAWCETEGAVADKVANLDGFVLKDGITILVYFTTANTSASALTLNVNQTGAKPVYIGTVATSSSAYRIPSGLYTARYINNSYWSLVNVLNLSTTKTFTEGHFNVAPFRMKNWDIKALTTGSSGYNYIAFANGFKMQWGYRYPKATSGNISFPLAFTSASSYSFVGIDVDNTNTSDTGGYDYCVGVYNRTATTVSITFADSDRAISWIAFGY